MTQSALSAQIHTTLFPIIGPLPLYFHYKCNWNCLSEIPFGWWSWVNRYRIYLTSTRTKSEIWCIFAVSFFAKNSWIAPFVGSKLLSCRHQSRRELRCWHRLRHSKSGSRCNRKLYLGPGLHPHCSRFLANPLSLGSCPYFGVPTCSTHHYKRSNVRFWMNCPWIQVP